jgi:hypothetical protein
MPSQESYFASFERTQDKGVRGFTEGGLNVYLMNLCEAGHGIQTAAADNADFCLLQEERAPSNWKCQTRDYKALSIQHSAFSP